MNNGRVQNMQYRHSPSGGFTNVQQNSQQSWGSPATGGWGAPARGRGRGNGRKSFNKQFGQTPRRDHNCNPGGSSKIEDYYHPSMLEDPWKYCTPVPATQSPMAVT
ncbi:hypothetical protein KUTeg_008653 [Tegillarca granosa]|uniref:Uncharacterized protein n=1 Tax=Tegillarca granosa TaxID=220873 RepID=A0ABQ9F9Q5_TEGGR|nr:hypothetical protein KUTeg_008653 [Tegillarca granosa]